MNRWPFYIVPLLFITALILPVAARAETFWQKPGGDWKALQAALAAGQIGAGDTVMLEPGDHGTLLLVGLHFNPALTFRGAKGAHVQAVSIKNASGLVIRELDVWPTAALNQKAIVQSYPDTSDIIFSELDIRSRADAPQTYLNWTQAHWLSLGGIGGVRLEGIRNAILASQVTATGFAITALGPAARIEYNHVLGFTGDGLRALADSTIIRGNTVENCIKVDDNHDDGFQAWAPRDGSGSLQGLRIEDNRIFEWRGPNRHPLRCRLQGIGLFDGPYWDFTIANNLVVVTAYHGISFYGGHESRIVNNTVLHPGSTAQDFPWIMVQDAKGGGKARGNVIANNLAARFSILTDLPQNVPAGTNATISDPAAIFRDPVHGDYRLKPSSGLTSAGLGKLAPPRDIDGTSRPQGKDVDLGAFETK